MKKAELKQVLKPLIKECIKEVIFEEGVLSGIISEVVRGTSNKQIVEAKQPVKQDNKEGEKEIKQKMREAKQKLLHAIGSEAYGGVNVFEGTRPIQEASAANPFSGVASNDQGVDITQIPGMRNWKLLANK